jgi:replication factor C small subunit
MLWTEKYRPQSLEEILGQDKFVSDARNWKEGMPNLLLYGEAGIGKTAAAGVIANFVLGEDKESNFFEINASDDRRLEVVRTTIKEISSAMKIGDVPHKVILLDEMDGMTPDAQNALKRLMERYSSNVRFIITCNHRHKIIYPLQSRCANYGFTRLSDQQIAIALRRILSAEGISDVDFTQLEEFIGTLNGDLRRGITELQASVSSDTSLTMQIERMQQPYNELLEHILNDQYELALNKMHDMIHMSLDMKTICIGIHDVILKKSSLPTAKKFKYLRVVGESEWRSGSMTPKVLAAWMVGQLI